LPGAPFSLGRSLMADGKVSARVDELKAQLSEKAHALSVVPERGGYGNVPQGYSKGADASGVPVPVLYCGSIETFRT